MQPTYNRTTNVAHCIERKLIRLLSPCLSPHNKAYRSISAAAQISLSRSSRRNSTFVVSRGYSSSQYSYKDYSDPLITFHPFVKIPMESYEFPTERFKSRIQTPNKTPLVLIACGSFSPITYLHLRMFEMAADFARFNTPFEVCGAYLSAVGDAYRKIGLVEAEHRINMCNLAVSQSGWIDVDPWEALHEEYLETAKVLDHFNHEINVVRGGVDTPEGKKNARIALLAGADLIQTMSTPGVWTENDIDYILRNFGAFIIERNGTDIDQALSTLQRWRSNIYVINQPVQNDVSSTKIRLFRRRDMSIRYLVPEPVVKYIEQHFLYGDDMPGAPTGHDITGAPTGADGRVSRESVGATTKSID